MDSSICDFQTGQFKMRPIRGPVTGEWAHAMTSVDCHLWQDLDSPRKHASMCIPEKLSMLDSFWACPWRMTLMRLVEVGRSVYCEWHHSLGWLLDCITRKKWVKHRHSLLSSSDTDRTWPHASSSCCLHFPTLTMGQNKPFAFTGLFIIIARAARLEQHTQVYSIWGPAGYWESCAYFH